MTDAVVPDLEGPSVPKLERTVSIPYALFKVGSKRSIDMLVKGLTTPKPKRTTPFKKSKKKKSVTFSKKNTYHFFEK
tara:strand:+ start:226 stop:456 length:231 start_codon:yes stop_codon:yes gene_type:complete